MVDLTVLVADEGRCVEEDLVKSFFPSLFDSDSESDDVYCLRSLRSDDNDTPSSVLVHSSPESSTTSIKIISELKSPITKANSTSLLHLSRCQEALPDSGSPLSQENSSHTVFQTAALEHSHSIGDQSPFHSVLSLQSSSSVLDADSFEGSPLKKQKVDWIPGQPGVASTGELLGQVSASEAQQQSLRSVRTAPANFQPQLSCSQPSGAVSLSRPLNLMGGITTGVPVDSCSLPPHHVISMSMTMGSAPSSHMAVAYSAAWPSHPHSLPAHTMPPGQMMGNWRSPQAMIPTTSHAMPCAQPVPAAKHQAPPTAGSEKVAAALAEVSRAPMAAPPLGLKLDKVGVMHQLTAMGMRGSGL